MRVRSRLKNYLEKGFKNWDLDIALRYLPIVDEIKNCKMKNPSILEVGSGPVGITPYLKLPITGVDIEFNGEIPDLLTTVQISGTKLPFDDKQFDFVICVDMLEHVPASQRSEAISEMIRVARHKLFLAVPEGSAAERLDETLDKIYEQMHGERYKYLIEHVENGLPRKVEILEAIDAAASRHSRQVEVKMKPNVNIFIRYVVMRLWMSRRKFANSLYRRSVLFHQLLRLLNFGKCYRQMFFVTLIE